MKTCKITVAIPTYQRTDSLLTTLAKICQCNPKPDEIIVHIDGDDTATEVALNQSKFHEIVIFKSLNNVGPGGGRNLAINQAKNPIIASFDDDSYPIDPDYFARLLKLFEVFPTAAVIGANIFHQNETVTPDQFTAKWVADFVGCGCAYRKDIFLQTSGYVKLPFAYGMEETDLSLRLHHLGWGIVYSSWLRVFHDTTLEHHTNPKIIAASIANQALLTYLRYPFVFWCLGVVQCVSRLVWLVQHHRWNGIVSGLLTIPGLIWQQHHHRQAVSPKSLLSYLRLRRRATSDLPVSVE